MEYPCNLLDYFISYFVRLIMFVIIKNVVVMFFSVLHVCHEENYFTTLF